MLELDIYTLKKVLFIASYTLLLFSVNTIQVFSPLIITYVLLKPKKILMAIDHATEKSSPIMNKNNKQTEAQTTKVVSNRAPIRKKKELSNKNHLHTYVLKLDATKPAICNNKK